MGISATVGSCKLVVQRSIQHDGYFPSISCPNAVYPPPLYTMSCKVVLIAYKKVLLRYLARHLVPDMLALVEKPSLHLDFLVSRKAVTVLLHRQ